MTLKPLFIAFGFAFIAALSSCATTRESGFAKVTQGMDKQAVLEFAGSPDRTQRWHGKDRWTYVYRKNDTNNETKEIQFEQGRVVYIGDVVMPKVTAEQQDKINDDKTLAEQDANRIQSSTQIRIVKPNYEPVDSTDDNSSPKTQYEPLK